MADKVRERNPDKMAEKSANNPTLLRTVPDGVGMRMEEQEKGSLHLNQPPGTVPPPRKKTSSFQITSVTVGSRLSNDGGDDSADDLDESHTEDISSELLDISKTTDLDNDYSSEDAFSSVDQIPMPTAVGAMHPLLHLPNNGQGDASSQVSNVVNNPEDAHDRSIPWHTRFRVVKIESTEPFKRGRWICMDFLDPPPSQTEQCDTREGGSGNSSAASSVHYSESYIEIPIGQEMFYQQSDSQHHANAISVQAVHHSVTAAELQQQQQQQQQHHNVQPGLVSGQTQQQQQPPPQNMGQQGVTDYQNVVGGVTSAQQQQQQQLQGQSLGLPPQQATVPPTSIMPNQQMPVHHGSLPVPLQGQPNAGVPQQQQGTEFYSVPQSVGGGGTISAPQTQNEFQGAPPPGCVPTGDYSGGQSVPTSGIHHTEYGQVHPDYGQVHQDYGQVHATGPPPVSTGMMPVDYSAQTQPMQPQGDYAMPPNIPSQGDYMNMHQQQTEFMNVHQQSHLAQGMPPQQEYMHQQGEYAQAQSMGPGPNLQQQCNSMPPQGDYSLHQQQAPHMATDFSHSQTLNVQGNAVASNMGQGSTIPSSVPQQVPQQQQSQSCVPQPSNMPPQSQSLPNTVPQSISSIGEYGVGQANAPSNSQQTSNIVPPLSMPSQPQSGSSEQQAYSVSSSRPSTISLSSSALEGGEPIGSLSVAVTPPVLDNLGIAAKEGDDTESFSALAAFLGNDRHCYNTQLRSAVIRKANMYSASGSSTVAIDNKIEQAMDLVKSHLMFAVREEVDVLKEKITELMDRINQLEYENSILRAAASQETLAKLTQPPPKPPPPNPSS